MKTRFLALTALACAALLPAQQASAAVIDAVMIDDFVTLQDVQVDALAPPDQTGFSSIAAGTAIGGERDLLVTKTVGGDGERVRGRTNPLGLDLLRMTIDDARGMVQVGWDGADGASALNTSGLGGVDLTSGLLDPFFELKLTFSDIGGPIELLVYQQGGASFARAVLAAPGGVPSGSEVLLSEAFSAFTLFGGGTLDDVFTNVGAVMMTIDARAVAQEGWDMRLDYIKTRGTEPPPVAISLPGSLMLLGLGLALIRRRR